MQETQYYYPLPDRLDPFKLLTMFSQRRRTALQAQSRRTVVVAITLAGYLAGTLGFPMPQLAPAAQPQTENKSPASAPTAPCCSCHPGACSENCCCKPRTPSAPVQDKTTKPAIGPSHVTWVLAIAARECRGESTTWMHVPIALPPAAWYTWEYRWLLDHWLTPSVVSLPTHSTPPPSPPPRPC